MSGAGDGTIGLLLLIDTDPPSAMPDGRGFYPAADGGGPSDLAVMQPRLDAIRAVVCDRAKGKAVLALHTSPRYRDSCFGEPYVSVWRELVAAGAVLALHPHEDRADGGSLYDDPAHLESHRRGRGARWRHQALAFLEHAASHGGRLVNLDEAVRLIESASRPQQVARHPADALPCP